ncbi:MAG: MAPEG family protein [Alphaproteobacteria bacterium]|nr:MAPEG family protein [Alphaproteobacteria bacterium]
MAVELQQVLYAVVLALAYLVVFATVANLELGTGYTAGPRDEPPRGLSTSCARLKRAYENHIETLPWFIGAMLAVHLAGKVDDVTLLAGWTYLSARVLYLPAYYVGVPWLRSIIWGIASTAIFVIVFRALI